MVRDARQDALDRYARYSELAGLTDRQSLAVALRVGLGADGEPQPITVIASEFARYFDAPVSRQYISALIHRAKEKLEKSKLLDAFMEDFPAIATEKVTDLRMSKKRTMALIRSAVRRMADSRPIQYAAVLAEAGVGIPEHRKDTADSMTEEQSMIALFQDFGVRRFGRRAKICGVCRLPKPLDAFFSTRTRIGSPAYSYLCRQCNTVRCRELREARRKKQFLVE